MFLFAATAASAQDTIALINPSFEGQAASATVPEGWENCGPRQETAPDIQPGQFSVDLEAEDGSTYFGLVVRDNETWDAVSQTLERPLLSGAHYSLKVSLAHSKDMRARSRLDGFDIVAYDTPAKLIVWGGHSPCDKREVLFETRPIDHEDWKQYEFRFAPKKGSYSYLMFEAYYLTPVTQAYNGNILIDNLSAIVRRDQ